MKRSTKIIIISCVALSLILFIGYLIKNANTNKGNQGNTDTMVNEPNLSIQDYFPMKENVRYVYTGVGNEYASFDVMNDYIVNGKVQQRINNGGTATARVIELKDGKLTRLLSKGEVYYRENLLNTKEENSKEEVLLMEPLKKGTSWNIDESTVRTITGTSVAVTTPLGNYEAVEVLTEGTTSKTTDYYVKGLGLVKTVYTSDGTEISSSLSKIEENVALTQKVNFYYPNIQNDKIYYLSKDLSFKTNDLTKQIFENAYKETITNTNLAKVFSPNTKINSLYLNTKDQMVYIDLNSAFVKEMNAGSGYESLILQCIADTFGKYYSSDKVIITVDDMLYESGHIVMKKGEYIPVKEGLPLEAQGEK